MKLSLDYDRPSRTSKSEDLPLDVLAVDTLDQQSQFERLYKQVIHRLLRQNVTCPCSQPVDNVYRVLGMYNEVPVGIGSVSIEVVRDPKVIGRILGEGSGLTEVEIGKVWKLGVHHQYRHKGVGSAILESLETYVQQQGVSLFEFDVPTSDFQFYKNRGYQLVEQGESVICDTPELENKSMQFRMFKYS